MYSIRNGRIELTAINYGAIITSIRVPDRHGRYENVVLGHPTLEPYSANPSYFGAMVGRYANRIAGGRFALDGTRYQLATNDGPHHLHGGHHGFHRHLWTATPVNAPDASGVRFERTSPAGEEHYPGTLRVAVTYLVTSSDTVMLEYQATTDAATIVNLTQHTYFNLGGETSGNVLDHELLIHATRYLPVDDTLIPTGEIADVNGTPFDFLKPARLGTRLQLEHEQLRRGRGFDHTFVLRNNGDQLTRAAELHEPVSGRRLEVATTEPGVQLYSGQLLSGPATAADRRGLSRYAGLCLETQHFPDSPNQSNFPSVTLRPPERYVSTTTWRFSVD